MSNLILVTIKTSCEPCIDALEVLDEYSRINPNGNIVFLIDSDEESYNIIKNALNMNVKVYRFPLQRMRENLEIPGTPWGFCLNSEGQILTSFPFASMEWLKRITKPISKLIGDSLV